MTKRLRALQGQERLPDRELRTDERQDGAGSRFTAPQVQGFGGSEREAQLRRQERDIRRRQHAQPRRRERRPVDPRLHFAAFGETRAQEREACDFGDAGRRPNEVAQLFIAARAGPF